MADRVRKTGKKNRKWGRNATYCQKYKLENRRKINKLKRMGRTLLKQPNNKQLLIIYNKLLRML